MNVKLLLTLIASCISTLNAGSFANITTPAKKACNDVVCGAQKHPGTIALAGVVTGCLMYTHATREYRKTGEALERLEKLRKNTEGGVTLFSDDYKDRSAQLKNAIQEYETAQRDLHKLEHKLLKPVRIKQSLAKTRSESGMKYLWNKLEQTSPSPEEIEQELKEKEASPELKAAKERVSKSKEALSKSFGEEFNNLNIKALQNHYANLWYAGVCIAVASAASYSIYKAYPQLKKWFATYIH